MSISVTLWMAFMAKSAIVLALALVAAECCRGSAAFRHAVRSVAMVAALLLPLATLLLPNWEWRILPAPSLLAQSSAPAGLPNVAEGSTPPQVSGKSLNVQPSPSSASLPFSKRETPELYSANSPRPSWNWPLVLLLTWLSGATVLAIRVGKGIFAVHRLLGRAQPVRDGEWLRDLAIITVELKIRRPISLLESGEIDVPMTYGFFYPRLLLPATARSWQPSRRNAVIFHELAHIVRLDSLSQLFALLAEVVYWPNPLVWWHSSRMRLERERACDDFVLRHGTRASEYANQLLEIASRNEIFPRLVLPMARHSQLKTRLVALLDPATRRESVSKNLLISISAITLALVSALAAVQISAAPAEVAEATPATVMMAQESQPAIPPTAAEKSPKVQPQQSSVPPVKVLPPASSACFADSKAQHHHQINERDGFSSWNLSWSTDTCSATARAQGNVSFSPDSSSLESIAPGGYLEVSERRGAHIRYVKVTPQQGQLKYEYSIDGQPREFDAEAQAWFSAFLLGAERVSGMNARKRAPYLFEQGGPEAILNELRHTPSDYVSGIYVRTLLERTKLTPEMLRRTLQELAQRLESDYELGRILAEIATRYSLDDEASRLEFLKASSTVQSDYERSRVLTQLLQRPGLSAAIVGMAMKSAAEIKSDYEKGRLLVALASQKHFSEPMHQLYLQAASGIASDYERARTLLTLMEHARLSNQSLLNLLNVAAGIGSDYEKARVLTAAARDYKMNAALRAAYLRIASGIASESERQRALAALPSSGMI